MSNKHLKRVRLCGWMVDVTDSLVGVPSLASRGRSLWNCVLVFPWMYVSHALTLLPCVPHM